MDTREKVIVAIAVVVLTFLNPRVLRQYFWFLRSRNNKELKMEDYFTRRQQPGDKTFDLFTDLTE